MDIDDLMKPFPASVKTLRPHRTYYSNIYKYGSSWWFEYAHNSQDILIQFKDKKFSVVVDNMRDWLDRNVEKDGYLKN